MQIGYISNSVMFRIPAKIVVAGWVAIGAVCVAALLLVAGGLYASHPTPWNFPGDPPLFDLLIYAAGTALVINAPGWLLPGGSARGRPASSPGCHEHVRS